jgi:hypothetical protein
MARPSSFRRHTHRSCSGPRNSKEHTVGQCCHLSADFRSYCAFHSQPPSPPPNQNLIDTRTQNANKSFAPSGPLEFPFRRKNNFHRKFCVGCYLVVPSSFGSTLGPSTFLAHRNLFKSIFPSTGIFASWCHPVSPPRL